MIIVLFVVAVVVMIAATFVEKTKKEFLICYSFDVHYSLNIVRITH